MNEDVSGGPKESRSGNPRNLRYENKVNEMPESYPWQTYLCYPGGDPGKKDNFVIEASNLTSYLLGAIKDILDLHMPVLKNLIRWSM